MGRQAAGRPPSGARPGEGEVIARSRSLGEIVRYQSSTPGADFEGSNGTGNRRSRLGSPAINQTYSPRRSPIPPNNVDTAMPPDAIAP
jgi:pSer/pThr/pTyr-binding forkhead associated (FHA) protein